MHRPRRGAPVLTAPPPDHLPQAWVPRVVNLSLGLFLLACISPVFTTFAGKSVLVKVFLVCAVVPIVLSALLVLTAAARPGSLGRAMRRARSRRAA